MTRVVVQRSLNNAGNALQGRQSSSAPQSTTTSVPSSANSSTSSLHPPTHSSSLSVSSTAPPYPDDGTVQIVREGAELSSANIHGEDGVVAFDSSELSSRLLASVGTFEGNPGGEKHDLQDGGELSEDVALPSCAEEVLDGRGEVAQLTVLQYAAGDRHGDGGETAFVSGGGESGQELLLGKGKELAEDGRFSNFELEDDQRGCSTSEVAAGFESRAGDDGERSHVEETNDVGQIRALGPSSSVQAGGVPTSPPSYPTTFDMAAVQDLNLARPNSSQSVPEAVGCSYVTSSFPSFPVSSGSSRRASWLGSSGSGGPPQPRGGLSRRGSRVSKPSRNSPNSSRPSSPRGYGEGDGYNSDDEQNSRSSGSTAYENSEEREHQFEVEIRCRKNLEVRRMAEDGNCLFRAVADQVYGDAEMYDETRQMCIDYMEKERDHFSQFVTESFTAYCKRKRRDKVYGNNLEIQAMAEMYNRPIHIYSYSTEPINIFHGSYETDLPPIRLSYHRGNHYNSLIDPRRPAVGAGLGFGSLRGTNVDREQVKAALKAQQDQQIDKALLAEGTFYSDIELTEQEMQRMVMEASRAEFFEEEKLRQFASWNEETSTSAAAESSGTAGSPKSATQTMNVAATSTVASDSGGLTPNGRMLMSMGFSYLQVMEASSIFGDDVNNMLCYLLETESSTSGDGESMYRKKGKAAERQ
ncbi:unnamed protein product [Calypogeia fissa]